MTRYQKHYTHTTYISTGHEKGPENLEKMLRVKILENKSVSNMKELSKCLGSSLVLGVKKQFYLMT